MKKLIPLSLAMAMAFAVSGCGGADATSSATIDQLAEAFPETEFEEALSYKLKEGEEKLYDDDFVFEEPTDFEYFMTWSPEELPTEVGLVAEDGTEYTEKLTEGPSAGVLAEIPAGTYDIIVRNLGTKEDFPDADSLKLSGALGYHY